MKETIAKRKVKGIRCSLTGNQALAEAMRQVNPDVMAAYPITPSTPIVETFSQYVADGVVDTELVTTESEHSAMSACVGAAAAGGRVMTATGSQGLAFMYEVLYVVPSLRLPVVIAVANRALNSPLNIHGDHSDTMALRDSGWIHLYSENAQECYDNVLQAVRIAEHEKVLTPVMVCEDAFQTSHMIETLEILPDEVAKKFIGTYKPLYPLLDTDHPVTYGAADRPDYYMEHKRNQLAGITEALEVIPQIGKEYGELTGRSYGMIDSYRLEDADYVIVIMSAVASTVRHVVDKLRTEGVKAGMLKIRCFRPFPFKEAAEKLSNVRAIAVLDRCWTGGAQGGPLFLEISTALYHTNLKPAIINYVYGLGGRDLFADQIEDVFHRLEKIAKTGKIGELVAYLNLRE